MRFFSSSTSPVCKGFPGFTFPGICATDGLILFLNGGDEIRLRKLD
jgi:hypothetical protein